MAKLKPDPGICAPLLLTTATGFCITSKALLPKDMFDFPKSDPCTLGCVPGINDAAVAALAVGFIIPGLLTTVFVPVAKIAICVVGTLLPLAYLKLVLVVVVLAAVEIAVKENFVGSEVACGKLTFDFVVVMLAKPLRGVETVALVFEAVTTVGIVGLAAEGCVVATNAELNNPDGFVSKNA